jgi:hypothetical protein
MPECMCLSSASMLSWSRRYQIERKDVVEKLAGVGLCYPVKSMMEYACSTTGAVAAGRNMPRLHLDAASSALGLPR